MSVSTVPPAAKRVNLYDHLEKLHIDRLRRRFAHHGIKIYRQRHGVGYQLRGCVNMSSGYSSDELESLCKQFDEGVRR